MLNGTSTVVLADGSVHEQVPTSDTLVANVMAIDLTVQKRGSFSQTYQNALTLAHMTARLYADHADGCTVRLHNGDFTIRAMVWARHGVRALARV